MIDEIRLLEELKSAAAAAQARAAAAFDASTRRAQVRAGLAAEQLGRGVGAQIGLARRESPHRGNRLLGLARILTAEMPHTLHALSVGVLSEWRATLLVRETACLSRRDRGRADAVVAGDLAGLGGLGDRALIARVRSVAYGLDPRSVVNRAAKAVEGRYVSCRPAPDTMTYLTGLLPVAQGVGVFAVLSREADRLRAAGDCRGRGQIMADTLVERVTGQARAEDARVEVQLIMTDRALLAGVLPPGVMDSGVMNSGAPDAGAMDSGVPDAVYPDAGVPDGSGSAVLAGYGVVPAQWARDLIRGSGPDTGAGSDAEGLSAVVDLHGAEGTLSGWGVPRVRPDPRTEVWLRRLYAVPGSGRLVAMDSKARLVPKGLARFIAARDRVCRMPWCGAPIRHYDHVVPVREGGLTSAENVQGLCEACNQAKEAPGWTARTAQDIADHTPDGRHTVVTTTPTGHVYRSIAPCPPALE
ncbi:HNH endonuclease signature motif containing protein [Arthrobacter sp. 08Y14]|uniref:HNH endonuclease n=1 Tax=Arthrobacter sp. 08Y14 TaxID=2058885 RepID=UPI002157D230|nr:HNH endonuclease signature motif containing protein [Arthrobacter sp. 08Y14]